MFSYILATATTYSVRITNILRRMYYRQDGSLHLTVPLLSQVCSGMKVPWSMECWSGYTSTTPTVAKMPVTLLKLWLHVRCKNCMQFKSNACKNCACNHSLRCDNSSVQRRQEHDAACGRHAIVNIYQHNRVIC